MKENKEAYEQFVREITDAVKSVAGTEWSVTSRKERKNNSVILDGMILQRGQERVAPNVYLNHYFSRYCAGESVERLAEQILELCDEKKSEMKVLEEKLDFSLEYICEHLYFRLVSRERNEALLQEVPFTRYLDLALVYYWVVYEDGEQLGSIMITRNQMERLGLTVEELERLAKQNTPKLFPAATKKMEEVVGKLLPQIDYPVFVLSNEKGINGATCLIYPGVTEELQEKMQGSFFVLPSSIHELIIIPYRSATLEQLCEMVYCINRTQVPEEDILSDTVYYYDAEAKVLQIGQQEEKKGA